LVDTSQDERRLRLRSKSLASSDGNVPAFAIPSEGKQAMQDKIGSFRIIIELETSVFWSPAGG
jgi:hypothetical protein